MKHMIKNTVREFALDRRGNVGMTFGLIAVSMVGVLGAATDFTNATRVKSILQNACDASSVAAVTTYRNTGSSTEAESAMRAMIANNLASNGLLLLAEPVPGEPEQNPGGNEVLLSNGEFNGTSSIANPTLSMNLDTGFLKILPFDIDTFDISVECEAKMTGKKLEVSIMLDTTGSMNGSYDGHSKLWWLKEAAHDMLDILMPTPTVPTKVALVPFATRVNVGSNPVPKTGRPNWSTKQCPVERKHGQNLSEMPPVKGVNEFWIYTGSNSYCPPSLPIVPLSNDKSYLQGKINQMYNNGASGATAGHLGVAWSWFTISPEWSSVWGPNSAPVPYTDVETIKAVVLMTDGNFTEYHTGGAYCNGSSDCEPSRTEARNLCDTMKTRTNADGDPALTIYSVGFGLPAAGTWDGDRARETLIHCASPKPDNPAEKLYYFPYDGNAMRQAFQDIGSQLAAAQSGTKLSN